MCAQYAIVPYEAQDEPVKPNPPSRSERKAQVVARSEFFGERLLEYLGPLVKHLHENNKVDKRPLKTLVQTVEAILAFPDRCNGLLLSELGGYLDGFGEGGGGTKRLETLIHHDKWMAQEIEEFLLCKADQQLDLWESQGEEGLFIWDGVGLEKPESRKGEGLCPTRSGKAARLTHVKPGYYRPPSAPIFVPGLHGIGGVLARRKKRQGPVMLAVLRWWSSRGVWPSWERDEHCKLLRQISERWGRRLVHIFDRGYGNGRWLGALRAFNVRFIVRFKHRLHLVDAQGSKRAA